MNKRSLFLILCALCAALTPASGQFNGAPDNWTTFVHYKGASNDALDERGMQKVAEWDYYYYVTGNEGTISLLLPFEDYASGGGSNEPTGYFRWYDYQTDYASQRLTAANSSVLKIMNDGNRQSRGLFEYNATRAPQHSQVGVTYSVPSEAADAAWAGDVIACDFSCNKDFRETRRGAPHEPTLSIRYKFHILPAKKLADDILNAAVGGANGTGENLTFEDHKRIVFGAKDDDALMIMRLDQRDISNYYYYPPKGRLNHHVYYPDNAEEYQIKEEDFDTSTLQQASSVGWVVYDETRTMVNILSSDESRFQGITLNDLIGDNADWYYLKTGNPVDDADKPTQRFGSTFYVVVYALPGMSPGRPWLAGAPIANYEVQFLNSYPRTRAELQAAGQTDRLHAYIEANYTQAMDPISFDKEGGNTTLSRPTTGSNNMASKPSEWKDRAYGFVYHSLGRTGNKYSPLHGEYGFYKSANLRGVSDSGYKWWYTGSVLYDRTHELNGSQYGYFLYVDASDESRPIAAAEFKAELCAGMRLVFSAAVADMTYPQSAKPQLQFKLYGIERDDRGNEVRRKLIQSFASGDLAKNTDNITSGVWYQVYGRTVLTKNAGAENFETFRLVVDNMCQTSNGADYAIDDIRLYVNTAKIDFVQSRVLCPDELDVDKSVTMKIRAAYAPIAAQVDYKDTEVYYRFCDEADNPIELDYDGDGAPEAYGKAIVPATYDPSRLLGEADGGRPMFEGDTQGEYYLILANRHFDLEQGKTYHVSVAYPDPDHGGEPMLWGHRNDICSTFSDPFQIIKQDVLITDANGNQITTFRVTCNEAIIEAIELKTYLQTVHPNDGTRITLSKVKYDYFIGEQNAEKNNFAEIEGLQVALEDYRRAYPSAAGLNRSFEDTNKEAYDLLKRYVGENRLVLSRQTETISLPNLSTGRYEIMAIPIQTTITEGGLEYFICSTPMPFTLRVVEDGPQVNLGLPGIVYPEILPERSIRLGLPHLRAMAEAKSVLNLPVQELVNASAVTFENNGEIYVSGTNDPNWNLSETEAVGSIGVNELAVGEEKLPIRFNESMAHTFREGYWYELNFTCTQKQGSGGSTVSCPGETFFILKIVPEYLTWNSSYANRYNANWNNDANWVRSAKAEIYKKDYVDYSENAAATRPTAYAPMRFTKVTIPDQTGKVYPCLGHIEYREANGRPTKLTNTKSEPATANIEYDIVVAWNKAAENGGGSADFDCEPFDGNLCDEIYLKPGAEVLQQHFLSYNKAWIETSLVPNVWYTLAAPLQQMYAGDFYVPYATAGQQRTEAFQPIAFNEQLHSRTLYPFYQRNWDKEGTQVVDGQSSHGAYDYAGTEIDAAEQISLLSAQWSHSYNDVAVPYDQGEGRYSGAVGFAIKAGDRYYPTDRTQNAIVRLPKADESYTYYTPGSASGLATRVDKSNAHRFLIDWYPEANANPAIQTALSGASANNAYFLIGNPYIGTLSMYYFFRHNPHLERKVWWIEDGVMKSAEVEEMEVYDKRKDALIPSMQSFFVTRKTGEKQDYVEFTASMTTDRYIVGGEPRTPDQVAGTSLSLSVKTAHAADGASVNKAKVVLDAAADRCYAEEEDVEMLSSGLTDVLQVYTVASDKAVAVNTLPDLNWLPLGVVGTSEEKVLLTVDGIRRIGQSVWLYDAATKGYQALADGEAVPIEANAHGRYFLATSPGTTGLTDSAEAGASIACYSPAAGLLVVTAPAADCLHQISVYSTDGKLVATRDAAGCSTCEFRIAPGVYVVHVAQAEGSQSFKIVVR